MYEQQIEAATLHFKKLLAEQLLREQSIKSGSGAEDFSKKDCITIGIIEGDGIGAVIVPEAERALNRLLADDIAAGRVIIKNIAGLTLENRLATGLSIPTDVMKEIKSCDVLLKGPTTTPNGGTLESANVTLRRELDLYANVRPVVLPGEGIDWIFFRENTEGEYALGSRGIDIPESLSVDFKVTTESGTRRIARAAFEYAKNNRKTNVSIVTKANIMKKTDGRFSAICHEVAAEYPGIVAEEWYVDIMAANLINSEIRSKFQVFLTPNLYGDILTDEAAQIQGGVGTAGSANTGDRYAMFEAIHGSAPRMISEGLGEYANPSSILKATEMLLRHISRPEKADRLAAAMDSCLKNSEIAVTGTRSGATCREFCDSLLRLL